jgi:hypothetical protein
VKLCKFGLRCLPYFLSFAVPPPHLATVLITVDVDVDCRRRAIT